MNVSLKSVKYMASLSEETNAFTATICIDGVKVGTVRNAGHGGPNDYGVDASTMKRLNEWAATLPPITFQGMTLTQDIDLAIGKLFDQWLADRDLKKLLNSRVVMLDGDKLFQSPKCNATVLPQYLISYRTKYTNIIILNDLPFDQAASYYRKIVIPQSA